MNNTRTGIGYPVASCDAHRVLPGRRVVRARWFRTERFVQDPSHDWLGVETGLRDLPGGAAMPLVVRVDGVQCTDGLRQRREPKQAFPAGQIGARTGMLHDRRFPAREIAQRPVADPRALEFHVGRLGATELTARAL